MCPLNMYAPTTLIVELLTLFEKMSNFIKLFNQGADFNAYTDSKDEVPGITVQVPKQLSKT